MTSPKPLHHCDRAGCAALAKWQIGLRVWALGTAPEQRTSGNCLNILLSVVVCDSHRGDVVPADCLTDRVKERIGMAMLGAGKAIPAFAGAKIGFMEIIDGAMMAPDAFARTGGELEFCNAGEACQPD